MIEEMIYLPKLRVDLAINYELGSDYKKTVEDIWMTATSSVLASVASPDWRIAYLGSVAMALARNFMDGAGTVFLTAIQGNPINDQEVQMIDRLMEVIGLKK